MSTSALSPVLTTMPRPQRGFPAASDQPDKETQPISALDQKNPEYEARYDAWLDLSLLYEGGAALKTRAERILKKRPREDEEVYTARLDRFSYQNILGTGLGWYGAAMFGEAPEIFFGGKPGSDFYAEFLSDCDDLGTSYIDFWKKQFQVILTYGKGWVLTDLRSMAEGEEGPKTLLEERDRKLLDPHVVGFTPLHVINWREDEDGEILWAVAKVDTQDQEFLGEPMAVSRWYYYDRENFKVYEYRRPIRQQVAVTTDEGGKTATLIRSGKHALSHVGRVPLRKLELTDGLWLANRAYLLLIDHVNQDNSLAWALFMSNLAMPVIIGDVDPSAQSWSESGYIWLPSGSQYTWSEPTGNSFDQSAKRVESLREECFRSMHLQAQGRSMRATPAMQSGRSKQLEMVPAREILASMGGDLRKFMQDVLVDVSDARRDEKNDPDVRGFAHKDDMTTEEVFAVSSVLGLNIPSEKFEKTMYKRVVKAWMSDANRDELNQVYKEIDEGPTAEEREQADLRRRVKMVRDQVEGAAGKLGGAPEQPPGRGGAGSPPPKTNVEGKGKERV